MNEKVLVHYRELQCIACNHMTSWIEFRLPNYCPECGCSLLSKPSAPKKYTVMQEDKRASLLWDAK